MQFNRLTRKTLGGFKLLLGVFSILLTTVLISQKTVTALYCCTDSTCTSQLGSGYVCIDQPSPCPKVGIEGYCHSQTCFDNVNCLSPCYYCTNDVCKPTGSCACTCTAWVDAGLECGNGDCAADEKRQSRTCNPTTCSNRTQCVYDESCATQPVNGVCSSTHYNCTAGTSANNNSGATTWTWTCNGSDGGTNASCSEVKPSCTLSLTASAYSIPIGSQSNLTANTTPLNGTISKVDFSEIGGHSTLNPTTDGNPTGGFTSSATGVSVGNSNINAVATMNDGLTTCSNNITIIVTTVSPWWQVKDGDVVTNGDLNSTVPSGYYFNTVGAGGFPGVPVYGGSTNLTAVLVSVKGWLVNSVYNSSKVYNSSYFINSVPDDVSLSSGTLGQLGPIVTQSDFDNPPTPIYGYYWYQYDPSLNGGADLIFSGNIDIGSKKVILIVKGADTYLTGKINLTKGSGFFMLIAGVNSGGTKGNIIVDSGVGGGAGANLEGIYVADGQFSTGTTGTETDSQLWIRGSVVSYGGFNLQRHLGNSNNTTAAELFEYAPDLELLYPSKLGARSINWQEVAP